MISLALISLAAIGWLTHEPSADAKARRRIRQWRRERLVVEASNRRRP